jgi:hypothetical protein
MGSTEIVNKTTKPLKLKVGNNLVFTDLTVVLKDHTYKVHVDPNATYQEYLMGKDRHGKPVIISSDDCADNKQIIIQEDKDGNFSVVKKTRNPSKGPELSPSDSTSESGSSSSRAGSSSKFWKIFSFRSSP